VKRGTDYNSVTLAYSGKRGTDYNSVTLANKWDEMSEKRDVSSRGKEWDIRAVV
jgi:hypothetical protein